MADEEFTVLPDNYQGGPKGFGQPEDRSLRYVEKEILIPQLMRDRAKVEKCIPAVEDYQSCCKDAGLLMSFKCKAETKSLYSCLEKWYKDEGFKKECTEQYLKERAEFRRTGLSKKQRRKGADMF